MYKLTSKKIIILGASTGIGREIAILFAKHGYKVAIAARREDKLKSLQALYPTNIIYKCIDITSISAKEDFLELIKLNGGMDIYVHVSGIGYNNPDLDINKEVSTIQVNALGFTSMISTAFNYFKHNNIAGQIACVSSIAGTRGMGSAAAYSSSKKFQNTYIESLDQLSRMQHLYIKFTDIRPGFVATDLLDTEHHYPMQMNKEYVAKQSYKAIIRQKRTKIIDYRYAFIVFLWKLIPSWWWIRMKI